MMLYRELFRPRSIRAAIVLVALLHGQDGFATCTAGSPLRIQMSNVDLDLSEDVVLRIDSVEGTINARSSRPISLNDPTTFQLTLDHGVIRLSEASVASLVRHALAAAGVTSVQFSFNADGTMTQSGRVLIVGSFKIDRGKLEAVGNEIRIDKKPDYPHWLAKRLGKEPARLLKSSANGSMRADAGDTVFIKPEGLLLHLLAFRGQLTSVRVVDKVLIETYGTPPAAPGPSRVRILGTGAGTVAGLADDIQEVVVQPRANARIQLSLRGIRQTLRSRPAQVADCTATITLP